MANKLQGFFQLQDRFWKLLNMINMERLKKLEKGISTRPFNIEFCGPPYSGRKSFMDIIPNFLSGKTMWLQIDRPPETLHRPGLPEEALEQLMRVSGHNAKWLTSRPEWKIFDIFAFNEGIYNSYAELEMWKMLHQYPEKMYGELEKWLADEMRIKSGERKDIDIRALWPGNIRNGNLNTCLEETDIEIRRLCTKSRMGRVDVCFFCVSDPKKIIKKREEWKKDLTPEEKCIIWFQMKAWNKAFSFFQEQKKPVVLLDTTSKQPSQLSDMVLSSVIEKLKNYFIGYVKKAR